VTKIQPRLERGRSRILARVQIRARRYANPASREVRSPPNAAEEAVYCLPYAVSLVAEACAYSGNTKHCHQRRVSLSAVEALKKMRAGWSGSAAQLPFGSGRRYSHQCLEGASSANHCQHRRLVCLSRLGTCSTLTRLITDGAVPDRLCSAPSGDSPRVADPG
jgi:hypothetical protein